MPAGYIGRAFHISSFCPFFLFFSFSCLFSLPCLDRSRVCPGYFARLRRYRNFKSGITVDQTVLLFVRQNLDNLGSSRTSARIEISFVFFGSAVKTSINRDASPLCLDLFVTRLSASLYEQLDLCTLQLISIGKLNTNLIRLGRMTGFQISFKIVQSLRLLLSV